MKKTKLNAKYPDTNFKTKFVDNVRYMQCENSVSGGKYWTKHICENFERVSDTAVSVVCGRCIAMLIGPPVERIPREISDKPKGWKFMKEYVHEDGTVYHKGVEQPQLFGTLNPTVIEEKPEKKKLSKKDKESRITELGSEIAELKTKLFHETRKTVRAQMTKDLNKKSKELKKLM